MHNQLQIASCKTSKVKVFSNAKPEDSAFIYMSDAQKGIFWVEFCSSEPLQLLEIFGVSDSRVSCDKDVPYQCISCCGRIGKTAEGIEFVYWEIKGVRHGKQTSFTDIERA